MPHPASIITGEDCAAAPSAEATLLGTGAREGAAEPGGGLGQAPTSIGRYVVVRHLGAGAMGAVYEARDPDLDRPVALKLVRGELSDDARQRMQREALALARVSHPNVVQIHEIGRADGHTFIAMELVDGQTLEHWQRQPPRPSWREALRHYAQAGEGLAAAHAVGLVHRDFKPSNCMLGHDGRVRVVDFGLAKGTADEVDVATSASSSAGDDVALPLTRTGAVVGTPAYMPPEQLGRGPVGAAADQFSFCVSLYEALYGERPFRGQSLAELLHAVIRGQVQPAPREARVPGWVRKVVVRGLASEPERRWPSMRRLLDALADDPVARRHKRWAVAGGVLLVGCGAFVALGLQPDARACRGARAKLEGAWDEPRRDAVERALLGTGLSFAPDTWERVRASLDDYGDAWVRAHEATCEATQAGEQSEALLDLRMACLDERRRHLRATVNELSHADPTTVERAVQAVLALPRLERCADADALMAEVRPPEDPQVAQRVDELRAVLVQAQAKRSAGKHREGLALVEPVVAEATTLGHEPLVAEAWLQLGWLRDGHGDYEAATEAYERAYGAAVAQRMPSVAADASRSLVWVLGERMSRFDRARDWEASAEPLSRAAGTEEARAAYLNIAGVVAFAEGELEEAREALEQALALNERALGPEALAIAAVAANLGGLAAKQGELEQAREHHERALAIEERWLGLGHPSVAASLANLGVVARMMGEPAKARDYYARALTILEAFPAHPDVARMLANLGNVTAMLGESAKARGYFERSLAILEATVGPEHAMVAVVLGNLGDLASLEGDHARALEHHRRALAVLEAVVGPEHSSLVEPLTRLGAAWLGVGEPARAIAVLERALALGEGQPPTSLAEARLGLARARLATGDADGARAQARLARTAYAQGGEAWASELASAEAWLAEHGER